MVEGCAHLCFAILPLVGILRARLLARQVHVRRDEQLTSLADQVQVAVVAMLAYNKRAIG
eukprot:7162170-Prymnesium_polylepis.1